MPQFGNRLSTQSQTFALPYSSAITPNPKSLRGPTTLARKCFKKGETRGREFAAVWDAVVP